MQVLVEREPIHSSIKKHPQRFCKSTTEVILLTAGIFNDNLIVTGELLSKIDALLHSDL